ncbi:MULTISPECIES: MFS transporter [unclassified Acinetobacter]|uniref:MFS transporter n=1 Tax=unclassified Acinetobacter TaxID=196816 RepID=UPI00293412A2|nr:MULTISPECIES: MFS transporter [unclassified Acinetobacter]WOE31543.1 MFS transporter [Acinetobacter sp. SAAs470]WOE39739.1 MFS transporter [Acinetobacter sp. SAAs474]
MENKPTIIGPIPDWTDDEKPTLPGSPAFIQRSLPVRSIYLLIGFFIAIAGSLSNGFITANLPIFEGQYALTASEAALIPAVYVMANVSSNLLLFKSRQQFGLRAYSEVGLLIFIIVILLHLFVHTFAMALFVRAISGLTAAPLSSLGMYYIMQAFGKQHSKNGMYLALGCQQLGIPLAWIISPSLTEVNDWGVLYGFELGLALCCFALVVAVKLPRSLQVKVFEKKDFITFILMACGFGCLCLVLTQGPIVWWFNAPWLAYFLITGLILIACGLFFESRRKNPLIMTEWLGTAATLRFIISACALRFLLSEQSYAAVNFLKTVGMGPEQFVPLYTIIFFGVLAGTVFSAFTFSLDRIVLHLLLAELLILIACALDHQLTSAARPVNFYWSQFLISFATGIFMGPLLLTGMMRALKSGATHMITFVVLFSATQNFGGLMGSAFYSTYQQIRTQTHQQSLKDELLQTDPLVQQQLDRYKTNAHLYTEDQTIQHQLALEDFNRSVTTQAQVSAYNDVITLNAIFAILLLCWGIFVIAINKYLFKKQNISPF